MYIFTKITLNYYNRINLLHLMFQSIYLIRAVARPLMVGQP